MQRRWAAPATVVALAATLIRFRPAPLRLAHDLQAPRHWVAVVGPDHAVLEAAGALLWLVAVWLLIGLGAAAWADRTGSSSGVAASIARSVPIQLRRALFTSVGLSMLASPMSAYASPQTSAAASGLVAPAWPTAAPATSAASVVPTTITPSWPIDRSAAIDRPAAPSTTPAWPTDARPVTAPPITNAPAPSRSPSTSSPTADALPGQTSSPPAIGPIGSGGPNDPLEPPTVVRGPAWPTSASPEPTNPKPASPKPTSPKPTSPKPSPVDQGTPSKPTTEIVTVRPGDSLWSLTAQGLGPSASDAVVAVEWPYWYRQNRRVIGSNPQLLQPGQRLIVPSPPKGRS